MRQLSPVPTDVRLSKRSSSLYSPRILGGESIWYEALLLQSPTKVDVMAVSDDGQTIYTYDAQAHDGGLKSLSLGRQLCLSNAANSVTIWYAQWNLWGMKVMFPTVGVSKVTLSVSHANIPVVCQAMNPKTWQAKSLPRPMIFSDKNLPQRNGRVFYLDDAPDIMVAVNNDDSTTSGSPAGAGAAPAGPTVEAATQDSGQMSLSILCGSGLRGAAIQVLQSTVQVPIQHFGPANPSLGFASANGKMRYSASDKLIKVFVMPKAEQQTVPTFLNVLLLQQTIPDASASTEQGTAIADGLYEKVEGERGRRGYYWYWRLRGFMLYELFYQLPGRWVLTRRRVLGAKNMPPAETVDVSTPTLVQNPAEASGWAKIGIEVLDPYRNLPEKTPIECRLDGYAMNPLNSWDNFAHILQLPEGLHLQTGHQHNLECGMFAGAISFNKMRTTAKTKPKAILPPEDKAVPKPVTSPTSSTTAAGGESEGLGSTIAAAGIGRLGEDIVRMAGTGKKKPEGAEEPRLEYETIKGSLVVPKPAFVNGPFVRKTGEQDKYGKEIYEFDAELAPGEYKAWCELEHEDLYDWRRALLGMKRGVNQNFDPPVQIDLGDPSTVWCSGKFSLDTFFTNFWII